MSLVEEIKKEIENQYGENAQYTLNDFEVKNAFEGLQRNIEKGKDDLIEYYAEEVREKAKDFQDKRLSPVSIKVGDGVTIRLWSDAHACTVIKKTKCSVTVQRDKATLNPDFKPKFEIGGFAAHCTNQDEQSYTYARNENGETTTFRWSNKKNRYQSGSDGSIILTKGRHEFYDYNF